MSDPLHQLSLTLSAHRQNLTQSRQQVFRALLDHEPQTMHDLVVACRGQADRASVYRTIALFERLGIVQRLQIGWKYKLELSDTFHRHHHHLTCARCGQTVPLPEDKILEARLRSLAAASNFVAETHQIEIRGTCAACQSSVVPLA